MGTLDYLCIFKPPLTTDQTQYFWMLQDSMDYLPGSGAIRG